MNGREIGPLDSTIVARMVDKSAYSIQMLWHGWPINWPRDYQLLKDKNLCISILGLVHKSGN